MYTFPLISSALQFLQICCQTFIDLQATLGAKPSQDLLDWDHDG